MNGEWYYARSGRQYGPVTADQLKQLVATGQLSRTDVVWKEGLSEWIPATKVKGLFPTSLPHQPPPLPAPAPPPLVASATPPSTTGQQLHRQRIAIAIVSAVGMLATFLPWVHAPIIGSIAGTKGDGWITLALFIPALIVALYGWKPLLLGRMEAYGAILPAGIAALIGGWKIRDFNSAFHDAPRDNALAEAFAMSVQIGIGLYLVVAAGAGVAIATWLLGDQPKRRGA